MFAFCRAYLKSMRLYYAFVTGVPGWLGVSYYEHLARTQGLAPIELNKKVLIIVSLFLSWGINQIFNDYLGLPEDRINAPERPMVTGELDAKKALGFSIICIAALFAVTAAALDPLALVPLAAGVVLNVVYEYAKGYGIAGNIVFGIMISMCAVYGFLAPGGAAAGIFPGSIPALYMLVVTVNGVLTYYTYFKDYEGDRREGKNTLVVKHGLHAAGWIGVAASFIPSSLFIVFLACGYLPGELSMPFIYLLAVSVFLQIWTGVRFILHPSGEEAFNALETNFKAGTCFQAALIGLYDIQLAFILFIGSYVFIEFLFTLNKNSKA